MLIEITYLLIAALGFYIIHLVRWQDRRLDDMEAELRCLKEKYESKKKNNSCFIQG